MAYKEETKGYRLRPGHVHYMPNPDREEVEQKGAEFSHIQVKEGAVVQLTLDQYRSFKDKFLPAEPDVPNIQTSDSTTVTTPAKGAAKAA